MEKEIVDFCVVGAGFSGLACAYKLQQKGSSVCVLEARNRVGGRVYTGNLGGFPINWGGTFIGEGHERIYSLAKEFGCQTYPTYTNGDSLLILDGKAHRFTGSIPRINPFALLDLGMNIAELNAVAKEVPLDAPWKAKKAYEWDSQTLGSWIDSPLHALTNTAKKMLKGIWTGIFMSDPNEVSLLHALFLIHSLKSIEWIVSEKKGAQQDLLVGGMQGLTEKIAQKLERKIHFESAVRRVVQNNMGVDIIADNITVKARRVILAIPPILATRINYEPDLPPLKTQLMDRSPMGQAIRCYAIYEEPFWRKDGFSCVSGDLDGIPQACIDVTPIDGKPGILTAYIWGPPARHIAKVSFETRKKVFLDGLVKRYGSKAGSPLHFSELDWDKEVWTRGDMFAHYAPGVLTGFGEALREPCHRIHWAGTETATKWSGSMEGAVLSGERAADEVLAFELAKTRL